MANISINNSRSYCSPTEAVSAVVKDMSYQEYLSRTGQKDSRTAWKWWKIEICGMSEKQAIKAAYDPEWGYKPIAE